MKILYITDTFPPQLANGVGIVAYNLAKKMKELGQQVYVITSVQEPGLPLKINYQGLTIYQIYTNYHVRWRAYVSLYNRETIKKVRRIITEIKPEIIHFHNIHWYLSYAYFKIAKKSGAKTFLTVHDMMLVHYDKFRECVNPNDLSGNPKLNYKISAGQLLKFAKKRFNPLRNIIIRHYLKYIDKIFSVSDELKKALEINNIKNIVTIHNGLDIQDVSDQEIESFKKGYNLNNKKVNLYVGRISGAKGTKKLLEAISKVSDKVPNMKLLIVGKKERFSLDMLELAKELKIEKNLIFTGWIPNEEMPVVYRAADLVVVPSIYLDPFPTINLEAMAQAKPVVGTIFGGTKEAVVDGQTGFIVNPFNIEKFSQRLIELLTNDNLAKKMGRQGQVRLIKQFSLQKQAENVLKWYNK